jgi:phage terminase large subunit-like protein
MAHFAPSRRLARWLHRSLQKRALLLPRWAELPQKAQVIVTTTPTIEAEPDSSRSTSVGGTLDQFRRFCSELTTETGAPLEIYEEQTWMLRDYFDGVRETLILVPKKNGKSTLLASLALFHLIAVPDAECVIVAASRDQASIMLRQAHGFIRRSPTLADHVQTKQREIVSRGGGGRVRILASDVDTVDGVIVTLALIDELHRHKSPDLYGVLRDGLGPRDGQLLTISTAGDDELSALGKLRTNAYAMPGFVHDGAYRHVRANGFALHEWALDADDDRSNMEIVKAVNPAPWQTVEALRERHGSPSMTPWQWGRFACGVWMAGEESAISDKEWRACADPNREIPSDAKGVFVGIDLGWKWDTTAIVPVWRADGSDLAIVGEPVIVVPPRDGTATPFERIWEPIEEINSRHSEVTFVLDPEAGGEQLAQYIESELGIEPAVHSQKNTPMQLAAQRLSEAVSGCRISHPDDATLNAHVLAAAAKQDGERWKFIKGKRKRAPIDGVIALAMAHSTLIAADQPKSKRLIAF